MSAFCPELVAASHQGDLSRVRELVEAGADVNSVYEHGMGPLLTFYPEVIAYLLEQGADPNRQHNENGTAVLAGLAYMNQVECVRLLLDAGAAPNVGERRTGETPLHAVLTKAHEDRSEVVRLLLDAGADPNLATIPGIPTQAFWRDVRTRGETPLHRAAAFSSPETIELLLAAGADKSVRDANGDSPLSWASWHLRPGRVLFLLSRDDTGFREDMIAAVDRSHGVVP
jgi:ankyrin repeat protein